MRPVHIWWFGVVLFTPSLLFWALSLRVLYRTGLEFQFDWFVIRHFYLPMFGAILGFSVPLVCLRRLRNVPSRVPRLLFSAYLAVILTWAVIDVRCFNYQIGGHDENGAFTFTTLGIFCRTDGSNLTRSKRTCDSSTTGATIWAPVIPGSGADVPGRSFAELGASHRTGGAGF